MAKSLRKKINRKRSIKNRRQFAGKPTKQETLYLEGYQLYKDFLAKYDEYSKIDSGDEPEKFEEVGADAQLLLKNAVDKLKEAVEIKESDEITKQSAFLLYILSQVDEEELTYDMWPQEINRYLKIAADLGHGKACYLYSQLSDSAINSEGYSSSSIAKQAYLDKALELKNPDAIVSRAQSDDLSDMRDALTLLCQAYTSYKYMEISDEDSNLKLGYTKNNISNKLSQLRINIVSIFRDLFENEVLYITKNSNYQKIKEFKELFSNSTGLTIGIYHLTLFLVP
jgi:TPR repeat protein